MIAAALFAVVFAGFTVEASLGFGATLITVAAASQFLPLSALLPAFVPTNIALSAFVVLRHRDGVDWRLLGRRIVPLMGIGMPLGMWAFRGVDEPTLKLGFGLFVIVLAALELWRLARPTAAPRALSPIAGGALLVLGGVAHGAFASGGPLAVYVAGRSLTDKRAFRSTLSALWLVLNAALVAGYVGSGAFHRDTALLALPCAAGLVCGIVAGEALHRRVAPRRFLPLVHSLLLVAGIVLAARR